jgi:hypothetical protein
VLKYKLCSTKLFIKITTYGILLLIMPLGTFMIAGSVSVGKVVYGQQTLDIKHQQGMSPSVEKK